MRTVEIMGKQGKDARKSQNKRGKTRAEFDPVSFPPARNPQNLTRRDGTLKTIESRLRRTWKRGF
jgi:hypothetical protein